MFTPLDQSFMRRALELAARGIIQALCEVTGWSCGAVWRADRRAAGRVRRRAHATADEYGIKTIFTRRGRSGRHC